MYCHTILPSVYTATVVIVGGLSDHLLYSHVHCTFSRPVCSIAWYGKTGTRVTALPRLVREGLSMVRVFSVHVIRTVNHGLGSSPSLNTRCDGVIYNNSGSLRRARNMRVHVYVTCRSGRSALIRPRPRKAWPSCQVLV